MNYLRTTYTLLIFQKLSNDLYEMIHIPHTFDLFSLIDALENRSECTASWSFESAKYYDTTLCIAKVYKRFSCKMIAFCYDGNRNMFRHCMTLEDGSDTFSSGVYFQNFFSIPYWSLIYLRNINECILCFNILCMWFCSQMLVQWYISWVSECCEKATNDKLFSSLFIPVINDIYLVDCSLH